MSNKRLRLYNRELSWLSFNNRVLQEAQDPSVPLIQRLRFLGIFSNNQDEFIKVRVANLKRMVHLNTHDKTKQTGDYMPEELLERVNIRLNEAKQIYNQTYFHIIEELKKHHIYIVNEKQLTDEQKEFCFQYFQREISAWLIPILLQKSTKLPFLNDNSVYLGVRFKKKKAKRAKYAILQIPSDKKCARFLQLPVTDGKTEIIFLDDIIRLCINEIFYLFPYDTISVHAFRFIRDAELTLDDDISKSILEKMESGLEERLNGEPIRMEYDRHMPADLLEILSFKLRLSADEMHENGRYQLLRDLMNFPKVCDNLELKEPPALLHPDILPFTSIFHILRQKDIFLNFPYHTFNHIIDFLREAAIDPKVKSIYITLYRTAFNSKVIYALINAAKNGKKVVVMEELMARFDEEQNVENSDKMHKAGITVIHGFKDLKVHSKLILIECKDNSTVKGYVYVGTGNFNETTARIYTDFGLLTTDKQVISDAKAIFDFLMNTHKQFRCKELVVSPYYMRKKFESLIEREIKNKRKGKKAFIYAKFNSLTDTKMINLLYKAAQEDVEIRLLIRGACGLIPKQQGLSSNISVRSIVDKYLEHSRFVLFHNDGDEQVFILSADWMTRNLDRRLEVGIPIKDKDIRKTIKDIFLIQWSDNLKAREVSSECINDYIYTIGEGACRSQIGIYDYYKAKCHPYIISFLEKRSYEKRDSKKVDCYTGRKA